MTASRYQVLDYSIDAGTFAYLTAITMTAALVLALAPSIATMRLGHGGALKADARGATQGLADRRLSTGLVAIQMALAVVLLSSAGVLVRSFVSIVGAETGVHNPDTILTGYLRLPSDKYPSLETRRAYFDRLEGRLRTIAGIDEHSLANTVPVKFAPGQIFEIEGFRSSDHEEAIGVVRVGPDYFRVLGTPAVAGRDFSETDHASTLPVVIVNESFAARFWPGTTPLGKRMRAVNRDGAGDWRVVVGVVHNILQADPLRQQFKPLVYVPLKQEPAALSTYFLVRTSVPPDQLAQAIRGEVQAVDPDVPLANFGTLRGAFAFERDFMDAEHSELGKHAAVAPIFAAIAVLLAAIGLVAVIAHSVSQRTKEIGVRIAIGAAVRSEEPAAYVAREVFQAMGNRGSGE